MYNNQEILNAMTGGLAGGFMSSAFVGTFILVAFGIFAVYWIYTSLAWKEIGKKLQYEKDWLAWIPFARSAMIFQMGGFHWAWAFLWLIPVLGWIAIYTLNVISSWRIYTIRNYPGWFALASVFSMIPNVGSIFSVADLIILGFVAWKDLEKPLFQ